MDKRVDTQPFITEPQADSLLAVTSQGAVRRLDPSVLGWSYENVRLENQTTSPVTITIEPQADITHFWADPTDRADLITLNINLPSGLTEAKKFELIFTTVPYDAYIVLIDNTQAIPSYLTSPVSIQGVAGTTLTFIPNSNGGRWIF